MSKQKLYLMVGLPATGKSTYARNTLRDAIRICHDDLYQMMTEVWSKERRDVYHAVENAAIIASLQTGYSVVVDRTCLDKKTRKRFIELVKDHDIDVVAVVMKTPIDVAKHWNNNLLRVTTGYSIPEHVYDKMLAKVENVSFDEGFYDIIEFDPSVSKYNE